MTSKFADAALGAEHILSHAGDASEGERLLLLVDQNTEHLASFFEASAAKLGLSLQKKVMPVGTNHGEEPPLDVAVAMRSSSLIVALTTFSLAHSQARLKAAEGGARFLSLPQFSLALLSHQMIRVDYRAIAPIVRHVADHFTRGSTIHLKSSKGTNLKVDIRGRQGNYAPAFVELPGDLGSPPDIEANVSPLEASATGFVIVDGSITHPSIGLLRADVEIEFSRGLAISFNTSDRILSEKLKQLFERQNLKRRVLAEVGVGLNPYAELTGLMLSDEGTLGTVHLGLGSNFFVGGDNLIDFHLDFVIRDAALSVDDMQVLAGGEIAGFSFEE